MFFIVDMHPDLGDPVEVLGIELEQDDNDTATDFRQRFGEKLLWEAGVNLSALEKEDLRCGGVVIKTNVTYETRLKEWAGKISSKSQYNFLHNFVFQEIVCCKNVNFVMAVRIFAHQIISKAMIASSGYISSFDSPEQPYSQLVLR